MKNPFPLIATAATLGMIAAGSAGAQTQCGASYTVEPGDTIYQVTQQCRVTMSRIMDLNPGLGNPRDIAVGTQIRLEAGGEGAGDGSSDRDTYAVESGDTLYSIAQALGYSVFELLNANTGIDPFDLAIGQVIDLPGEEPGATVQMSPDSGVPGETVTLRADGLRPNDWVTLGVGPQASEWEEIVSVQVAPDGEIAERVDVPEWADPGDDLIFVVDTDRGVTFKSGVFDVTGGAGRGDENGPRTIEGRVSRGVECYTLETPDGDVWSLVSNTVDFTEGEYVEVEGKPAEASFCMQGVGTLQVSRIQEVSPPGNGG